MASKVTYTISMKISAGSFLKKVIINRKKSLAIHPNLFPLVFHFILENGYCLPRAEVCLK